MTALSSVSLRAEKAAQILSIDVSDLLKILADEGIGNDDAGLSLLSSDAVTVEDLTNVLEGRGVTVMEGSLKVPKVIKKLPAKAAASVLKGTDPFEKKEPTGKIEVQAPANTGMANSTVETIVQVLKSNRTPQQMKDRELLEAWVVERDYEMEQELHRRAKNQRFIILKEGKHEPGKEVVDIENSLDLLKASRRRENPSIIPIGDTVAPVYFITQLNMQDRIVETCPICGKILYKGYCNDCELNWTGIGDDERAYVHLIAESDKFEAKSHADRKAVFASAKKGLEDLKKTWPSLIQEFDELKATNDLPKLRQIEDRPSREKQDPFHVEED